jgi:hypothetical protein
LGHAFEKWGQGVIEVVGTLSREPYKRKVWEEFLEVGQVEAKVEAAFPGAKWASIRDTTLKIAKLMGERLRPAEVKDAEHVDSLVQLRA